MGGVNEKERNRVFGVLIKNMDKPFVKRVLMRDFYPKMDLGNGRHATHKMAWGESDGRYFVFPTVIFDGKQLKDYGSDAFGHAMSTGNFIEFESPEEADWFSRRYKAIWGE